MSTNRNDPDSERTEASDAALGPRKLKLKDLEVTSFLSDEEAERVWGGDGPKTVPQTDTSAPPHCPLC